jgi:hypothetical protein
MLMGDDRIHAVAQTGLFPAESYLRVGIPAKQIGVENSAIDVEAAKSIVGASPALYWIEHPTETAPAVLDRSNLVFGYAQFAHAALDARFQDIPPLSAELDGMLGRIGWDRRSSRWR